MGFEFLIAGLVLSAASMAYGITNQIASAEAAAEQQRRNAEVQANSLKQQAEQEEQNQLQRSMLERRQNARRLASAEAAYAASGVTVQGTPTLSLASMAEEQELDVVMQEAASNQKRKLLLADAENVLNLGYSGASLTESSGITSAVGMGLSGAANMAYMGYEASEYETNKGLKKANSGNTGIKFNYLTGKYQ
jgi:hypothetical protein|nr:MAG TPA: hypothetical protein [Caudoviricetes sp.]